MTSGTKSPVWIFILSFRTRYVRWSGLILFFFSFLPIATHARQYGFMKCIGDFFSLFCRSANRQTAVNPDQHSCHKIRFRIWRCRTFRLNYTYLLVGQREKRIFSVYPIDLYACYSERWMAAVAKRLIYLDRYIRKEKIRLISLASDVTIQHARSDRRHYSWRYNFLRNRFGLAFGVSLISLRHFLCRM